jgi:hypothetical protein
MPAEPLLLPLGALAFYLFDSLLMLYGNEVLVTATGRAGWRCAAGGDWLLAGRRPVLPNPLMPWRPHWRLAWRGGGARSDSLRADVETMNGLRAALRPLGVLVVLLQWLMLPGLALELALLGTGGALLLLLAAIYALVLLTGVMVLMQRRRLGLTLGGALSLAFEGLLCPPFAINLVRKAGLRCRLAGDALELAGHFCGSTEALALRTKLLRDQGQGA